MPAVANISPFWFLSEYIDMTSRIVFAVSGSFLLALFSAIPVAAQETPGANQVISVPTSPTVKEYGRPGYPKMTIYVWGDADTGVWNVEKGTDLLEFVSVVSRLRMTNNNPERRLIEKLSIYRNGSRNSDPYFESRIETLFSSRGSYPTLQGGDILVLESEAKGRFTWRDGARVVGAVATLLNTYLLLERIRD